MTRETKSVRSAYGRTLVELGRINNDIVVLDADLSCSTQTQFFSKEFPERFINCGIAEGNMVSIAAGLATTGKVVFAAIAPARCAAIPAAAIITPKPFLRAFDENSLASSGVRCAE